MALSALTAQTTALEVAAAQKLLWYNEAYGISQKLWSGKLVEKFHQSTGGYWRAAPGSTIEPRHGGKRREILQFPARSDRHAARQLEHAMKHGRMHMPGGQIFGGQIPSDGIEDELQAAIVSQQEVIKLRGTTLEGYMRLWKPHNLTTYIKVKRIHKEDHEWLRRLVVVGIMRAAGHSVDVRMILRNREFFKSLEPPNVG